MTTTARLCAQVGPTGADSIEISISSLFSCAGPAPVGGNTPSALYGLVEKHRYFFAYLRTNHPGWMGSGCLERLRGDSTFIALLMNMLAGSRYSRAPSGNASAVTGRPIVTEADLIRTAARFVYPFRYRADGLVDVYYCGGENGTRELSGPRNPMLEAMAYELVYLQLDSVMSETHQRMTSLRAALGPGKGQSIPLPALRDLVWQALESDSAFGATIMTSYVAQRTEYPLDIVRR